MGATLFAILAVARWPELDRDYIREKTLEGHATAAAADRHASRP
ncbi:hypothetical protein [Actinomadura coerulea]